MSSCDLMRAPISRSIKSSIIPVKLLYMCVEYFFSDGGCVFHFSMLALGKKKQTEVPCLSFSTVPVSGRTNILQTSWEGGCFKADEAHNQLWNIMRAVMLWELTKPHQMVLLTSLNETDHIWTARHCSLQNLPFLTLAIFVSTVWIPVELHRSVIRIFAHLIRSGETLTHLIKMCEIVGLFSNWSIWLNVAFPLMDCPEEDNLVLIWNLGVFTCRTRQFFFFF